jgi:hypothetical protein
MLLPPEPQGDIVHDPVAAQKFNQDVRRYVLSRLREEWNQHPRSLLTCAKLCWGLCQNLYATSLLRIADVRSH